MTQDVPSSGEDVVPASPASSEDRLGCFLDAIQKKLVPPSHGPNPSSGEAGTFRGPQAQQFKTRQQQARPNSDLSPW
jgi:hypothetical protein